MEGCPQLKICAFATLAISIFGFTYYIVTKGKRKIQDAVDALNYLKIKIISNEELCSDAVEDLRRRCNVYHAIGFDCEWVTENGTRQPVSLLQLSTIDGYCVLFRLNKIKTIPQPLIELLQDPSIYKVGVAPSDDARYLAQDYDISIKGTLDIRYFAELCGYETGGLASLSKAFIGVVLDKSWRIRCSNWSADELTDRQIQYAAADAHVAIKIFVELINIYKKKGVFWEFRKHNYKENLDDLCNKYADISYRCKPAFKVADERSKKKTVKKNETKRYPHATRSKPLYHNCFLEAPDGEILCTCDNKKAMWYVEKELADKVKNVPLTVRLRFEPSGRSVGEVGRYYQLTKENKCVVCGEPNSYIRKNVVPREYRKYFPEIIKDRSSHDVVLLCGACHRRSNGRDLPVRERLASMCDAPLAASGRDKLVENVDCKKIRSAARALLHQSANHRLPAARRAELEGLLLQHYPDQDQITHELLQEAANIQVAFENTDYESHGQKVVKYFLAHDGLLRLEEMWRKHFLSSMCPRYMPELWSIKHNEERLRIRLDEGRLSKEDMKLIGL